MQDRRRRFKAAAVVDVCAELGLGRNTRGRLLQAMDLE
jgi:hypothetical protein